MTTGRPGSFRLSTHVLDTAAGRPAAGITVRLVRVDDPEVLLGTGTTDRDGRVAALGTGIGPGTLRLTFDTAAYLAAAHGVAFYPRIVVEAALDGAREHYHLPVLLGTHSFTTYLGS